MQYKCYHLLIMDTDRQNNYTGYLGYLSSCGATYRKIGLAAKYVLIFLEEADELSRRGYRRYKQAHASELSTMPGATDAILDAIHRVQPDVVVDCYELMPENKEKLSKLDHIRLLGDDFTQAEHSSEYDLIVANPPFSKNQDIRHVMQMYQDLKPGGTVAAITSRHWQQASEKVCKDFRAFLEEVSAQVYEIEEGAFKKSGTGVGTIAIVINKK